eukprot:1968959-Amphidinium_carterae.2
MQEAEGTVTNPNDECVLPSLSAGEDEAEVTLVPPANGSTEDQVQPPLVDVKSEEPEPSPQQEEDQATVTANQVPDQNADVPMDTLHEVTEGEAPWTPPDFGQHPDDEAVVTPVPDDSSGSGSESGEPEAELTEAEPFSPPQAMVPPEEFQEAMEVTRAPTWAGGFVVLSLIGKGLRNRPGSVKRVTYCIPVDQWQEKSLMRNLAPLVTLLTVAEAFNLLSEHVEIDAEMSRHYWSRDPVKDVYMLHAAPWTNLVMNHSSVHCLTGVPDQQEEGVKELFMTDSSTRCVNGYCVSEQVELDLTQSEARISGLIHLSTGIRDFFKSEEGYPLRLKTHVKLKDWCQ